MVATRVVLVLAVAAAVSGWLGGLMSAWNKNRRSSQIDRARMVLHNRLSGVRVLAQGNQVDYEFYRQPAGRAYLILPVVKDRDADADEGASESTRRAAPSFSGWLPEGMRFVSPSGTAKLLPAERLQGLPHSAELRAIAWSAPMTFRADGTSSGGMISFADGEGRPAALEVRSGNATVGIPAAASR